MTVGPALILVNKQILTTYGFGYPMLVSGLGQASSAIGATFVVKIMKWQPLSDQAQKMTWSFHRRNMVVVGAAFAASLCFGNAGYMYLTVSFVQMLKAFTPCVVVAMLYVTGVDSPSQKVSLWKNQHCLQVPLLVRLYLLPFLTFHTKMCHQFVFFNFELLHRSISIIKKTGY